MQREKIIEHAENLVSCMLASGESAHAILGAARTISYSPWYDLTIWERDRIQAEAERRYDRLRGLR